MKINSIRDEPKTGDRGRITVVFENDACRVSKMWIQPNPALFADESPHFARWLRKAMREAERDIAYMQHGKKWREQIPVTPGFFASAMSEKKQQLFSQAAQMRPDLLPHV